MSQSRKETVVGAVALIGAVAIGLTMCGDSDEDKAAAAQEKARQDAACQADLQCIGDKLSMMAPLHCVDPVERLAAHSARWVDGTLDPKFSRFRWGPGKRSVTVIGDQVEFQNGFGAYTRMVYQCDLSLDGQTVLGVRASPGRL